MALETTTELESILLKKKIIGINYQEMKKVKKEEDFNKIAKKMGIEIK